MFDATPLARRSSSGGGLADLVRDPGSGGRRVKVVGRLEPCTGQTCLRARRITLAARPASAEP